MDVLIVERNELLAEVLADALDEEGFSVTIVVDDERVVERCEQDPPAVIVTGMNRRGEDMGGLHLVRAMRRRWPWLGAVYMAAFWPDQRQGCALALRERFLPKPVPIKTFVQTVRGLLPA